MPSWDQLMQLLDKVGLCGVTFLLLIIHMAQEERHRHRGRCRYEKEE